VPPDIWAVCPKQPLQGPWEAFSGVSLCLKEDYMRPNTSVRLDQEPLSAIFARVAYRLIQRDFTTAPGRYFTPIAGLGYLARQLQRDGWPGLSLWVAAYSFHKARGVGVAECKQRFVWRARWAIENRRAGKPWARVPPR